MVRKRSAQRAEGERSSSGRLEARLDRLESLDEIRQLVAKYCLALDMRDLDALCGLVAAGFNEMDLTE